MTVIPKSSDFVTSIVMVVICCFFFDIYLANFSNFAFYSNLILLKQTDSSCASVDPGHH